MTYMPQDFRGTLIRQQRERSERNKQAEVDALVSAGGSIHDRYALLWKQQMERLLMCIFSFPRLHCFFSSNAQESCVIALRRKKYICYPSLSFDIFLFSNFDI